MYTVPSGRGMSVECFVFRLSNLSPDPCYSFVFASLFLCPFWMWSFSMCCPVTHRCPTLALSPFICAEKDRWTRGLGTLWHHSLWRTDWRVEALHCKQTAMNKTLHIYMRDFKSTQHFCFCDNFIEKMTRKGEPIQMWEYLCIVLWLCKNICPEDFKESRHGSPIGERHSNNVFILCSLEVLYFTYSCVIFNFTLQKSSRNYSYVIWNYNVDPWTIRAMMVPVLQLNQSRQVRCRCCCCCCCFPLVSRCILVHVVLKYFFFSKCYYEIIFIC